MSVWWICSCSKTFTDGYAAFLHRLECGMCCKPVTEYDFPLKRLTGIEREEIEALDYDA